MLKPETSLNWTKVKLDHQTIASIDGNVVRSLQLNLPKMNSKSLSKAIPHLLTKELLGNITDIHIAHTPQEPNGNIFIWYLKIDYYQYLCTQLKSDQIQLAVPNYICLPYYSDSWTLSINDNSILVRDGYYTGFCQQENLLILTLNKKLQEIGKPNTLHLLTSNHTVLNIIRQWAKEKDIEIITEAPNEINIDQIPTNINLLSKNDTPKTKSKGLKAALVTFFSSILIYFSCAIAIHITELHIYNSTNTVIKQKVSAFIQEYLPNKYQNLSLTELQQHITTMLAHRNSAFNNLAMQLGKIMKSNPTANLQSISFHNKMMQVTLSVPNTTIANNIINQFPKTNLIHHNINSDNNNQTQLNLSLQDQ